MDDLKKERTDRLASEFPFGKDHIRADGKEDQRSVAVNGREQSHAVSESLEAIPSCSDTAQSAGHPERSAYCKVCGVPKGPCERADCPKRNARDEELIEQLTAK